MRVIRGKQRTPIRGVIYGVEGIGKTTLAAQFPDPVILDTEDGSAHLDCARVVCRDWPTLEGAMNELGRDSQGFRTAVIDSADWAERLAVQALLAKGGKKSIEDFGFGKGYVMLAEQFSKLLTAADYLISRGMHVVWVAHSKVARTSPPDETDGYDRYELKLTKHAAPLLREWADALLFATYKTVLVEGSDGRMKARGGQQRVIHTERCAAWDAKNRFGLPPEIPLSIEPLRALWSSAEAPADRPKWTDRVAAATSVEELGEIADDSDRALSDGTLSAVQHDKLRGLIGKRHDEIQPQEVAT